MGGRRSFKWRLFVDESGGFDRPEDDVATAGLLIPSDVAGTSAAHVREALEIALPGVPWPIHAAHLNRPAFFALAAATRHRQLSALAPDRAPPIDPVVQRALDFLDEAAPEPLQAALAQLAGGEMPDFVVLAALDRQLRENRPEVHAALIGRMRAAWATVARVIGALADRVRAAGHPVLGLASGEAERGDAGATAPTQDLGYARYASCLHALLQRAIDVVARQEGAHEIWIQVLSRPLIDPQLQVRVQLHLRHVGEIVRRLVFPGHVRMVTESVPFFDERADPALVLADFFANVARRQLRSLNRELRGVERRIEERVVVPIRSGSPDVSHLAATGRAEVALNSCRAGRPLDRSSLEVSGLRRWAREQAFEWCEVLKP